MSTVEKVEIFNEMDDPITDVVVVTNTSDCPHEYTVVSISAVISCVTLLCFDTPPPNRTVATLFELV